MCIGFRAAYLSVAVHGWTVRYETPTVRSDVADIARNHSPVWVRYRNTLAGAQFFVKFFDRVYRNTVRHSHQRWLFTFWGLPANTNDRTGELTLEPNG